MDFPHYPNQRQENRPVGAPSQGDRQALEQDRGAEHQDSGCDHEEKSWLARKTWKREVAFIMLVSLLYFGYVNSVQVLEILTLPFTLFVSWAFGLDWTGKNAETIGGILTRRGPK